MRHDMAKLLVERPRRRGGRSRIPAKPTTRDLLEIADEDDVDAPEAPAKNRPRQLKSREGMGAPYARKEFNDYLSPLKRLLASRVGQEWNRVYAELCRDMRCSDLLRHHLREHVRDLVRKVYTDPRGIIRYAEGYLRGIKARKDAIYVDGDGILRKVTKSGS